MKSPNRQVRCVVLPALSILALAAPAGAHRALTGGFRPVASEQGARALWVNPAAIGVSGQGSAVAELLVSGDAAASFLQSASEEEWSLPTDVLGFSAAAATDRLAYGFQRETEDLPGVPDWTFAVGNGVPLGQGGRIGVTAEWRGGNDSGLDATVGMLFPVGRQLAVGAVVHDVLTHEVDGASTRSTWQVGAALPVRSALGTFTWDSVLVRAEETVHWFGFAIDRSRYARASIARSTQGEWNATLDLVFPNYLFGIGGVERDGGSRPDRAFVAAEWSGRPYAGTAGGRRGH